MAATIEAQGAISETRLAEAFDRLDSDDSGYISAANLKEILGDDFPEEEIDVIIKEASKNGKISYSEFLALWEEEQEKKHEEIIQEITVLNDNRLNSDVSVVSNLSADDVGSDAGDELGSDFLARSNFIEKKNLSERKISELTTDFTESERKSNGKHVMFQEKNETIPSKFMDANAV